ncbi:DUF4349 domain-containing protein [Erythrobacter sp. MTPC3]|uniref:DUF4349 domain-containing protein n=1 Tax=Erythrobacter sp. MTPC3 TaxID=3056564 RepID=UPI0036F2DA31
MRATAPCLLTATLLIAACSDNSEQEMTEEVSTYDVAVAEIAEPPSPPAYVPSSADREAAQEASAGGGDIASAGGAIPVSLPQIAYRYALGFRLPSDAIKPLQERHADMCEARGANVCRIISMQQTDEDGDYAYGNLQLAIASQAARAFSKEMENSSGPVDGELVSSSIEGEDLSKQIVDTEARLRARTVLRDRLMEVLRTRRGTVAELVQAERGVAQVNQEIDQASSWLNEMRGRVAFSKMAISYQSGMPNAGGFTDPIRSAWGSMGGILGSIVGFLMVAVTVLAPIGLLAFLVFKLWRWNRRSFDETQASETQHSAPIESA